MVKSATNESKKIAWFGMRIFPDCIMAPAFNFAGFYKIAILNKYTLILLIRFDPGSENRQNIGTIIKIGHPAEALWLVLCAIDTIREVKPHQLAILLGIDLRGNLKSKFA